MILKKMNCAVGQDAAATSALANFRFKKQRKLLILLANILACTFSACKSIPEKNLIMEQAMNAGEAKRSAGLSCLDVTLVIDTPVIAEDQCLRVYVNFKNSSDHPIIVQANTTNFFLPWIRDAFSGMKIAPGEVTVSENSLTTTIPPGKMNHLFITQLFHGPCSYSFQCGGKMWTLKPGDYELGGQAHFRWYENQQEPAVEAEIEIGAEHFTIRGQLSDRELQSRVEDIKRRFEHTPELAWPLLFKLVQPGMRRSQVDLILPSSNFKGDSFWEEGSCQGDTYWVDAHWQVSLVYDYTGTPPNTSEPERPDNRLIAFLDPVYTTPDVTN